MPASGDLKMVTVKKIKIFADDTRNNTFLIQKDGQTFRALQGSRFFERLTVEKHWTGRKVFTWTMGTTPHNEMMKLLDSHISSGHFSECTYQEGFPEKL